MKAYKIIWALLRHPFNDVMFGNYTITHVSYNHYLKEYNMQSIITKISDNETIYNTGIDSQANCIGV